MSTNAIEVDAVTRTDFGKGASRRLRKQNRVPAILYGGDAGEEPEALQLPHNEVQKHLSSETFYSQILMLSVDGKERIRTILRDVQRHPYKQQILHLDFQRVVKGAELTMTVPLHFLNEDTCVGVKAGGIISHTETEISISCRPRDIPEYIAVDMAEIAVGESVHLSDLTLPEGVTSTDLAHGEDHDRVLAAIHMPRKAEVDEPTEDAPEEGDDTPAEEGGDD